MGKQQIKFAKIALIFAVLGILFSCRSNDIDTDENAERMQIFIEEISAYAKGLKPGFIIIPQNGSELAFNYTDTSEGLRTSYINAIDGFGIEELFYNEHGILETDQEILGLLRILKNLTSKKIMVSDYVLNDDAREDSVQKNKNEGFVSYQRGADNYYYEQIPLTAITDENTDDITTLAAAKNYLYLIGADTKNFDAKEDLINAVAATNYDVVLIDLFFGNASFTPEDIELLKIKANGGKRLVISYISIGSAEIFRFYWHSEWEKGNPSWIRKNYEGYPDEYWIEYWDPQWQKIIFGSEDSYIKKIINAGFDGAYLDNTEAYYFLSF